MPTATVTVKEKWLPQGKKRWVIKGVDGTMFGANADLANAVVAGQTYGVTYKEDHWNGKTYFVVEGIIGQQPQSSIPQGAPPLQQTQQQTQQQYQPQPTTKDEDIATLAIAKEQLRNIKAGDVEEGFHVLKASAMMWRKFKSWQKLGPQTTKEEFNDEIPY